jgi:alkylation response protein AidB-like acyl-CoA dehydrogenase
VPGENLLGGEGGLGRGFRLQMEGFENGRLQTAARAVGLMQVQLHGGMGYAEEFPVSRYYVDARVLSIFEGVDDTLALKVIARNLVAGAG